MKTHNGTRVKADTYGNPRYVWHYLDMLTDVERGIRHGLTGCEIAVKRARKIGGKRYRGRDFGGGIVFTTYSPEVVQDKIDRLKNS